ncbi:hypothetical protein BDV25DRAFT_170046 [Aspergillus avenaceus]|uniref:Uncharacterized protein n=1 Tax=Aspergillus avenaceus TaxID=36643 RepID=A0A5N6TIF3_ASPAV|nr:hypothetical protein BDV25DRAFT_170046 [Aspergillus avenaceus]
MESTIYSRTPYCSLCAEKFNSTICFRSVVFVNHHEGPILTEPLSFQGKNSAIVLPKLNIQILDSTNNCRTSMLAPSIHTLCWTAIDRPPSIRFVYNLGIAMNPLVWERLPQSIYSRYRIALTSIHTFYPLDNRHRTTLIKLIDNVKNLPPELICIVWEFIPPSAVRCLLSLCVAKTVWPAIDRTPASATIQLCGDICLYLTSTLDGTYISGICIGSRLYGYRSNWCLRRSISSPVAAITFTLGLYGLQQIDFLSKATASITKSSKATSQQFLGIIYSQSVQPPWIELEWDVMKISHFKWVPKHGNEQDFGHDFLWVSPWLPSQLYSLSESSFYNWPRSCDFTSRNQRFMAYVPLHRDGYCLRGLTAFCSSKGFVGLGIHFDTCSGTNHIVSWYGQQKGCPIHVRLARSENLTSISVIWGRTSKPYLAITTNKRRSLTLGPYISPVEIQSKTLFSGSDGDVLGLYYDISPGLSTFTSLGVICRPGVSSLAPTHRDMVPCMPDHFGHLDLLDASPWSSFVSRASLTNIKRLKVCYLGPRCTGMLLIYNDDGGISTLGQWYENTSLQADIFELDYRPDHVLRFSLVKTGSCQYVSRVDSFPRSPVLKETAGDLIHGDDIIWLYSPDCDIVLRVPA